MRSVSFLFISLSILFFQCNKKEDSNAAPANTFESFDRRSMLENMANNIILPAYTDFTKSSSALKEHAVAFENDTAVYDQLCMAWKTASISWSRCSLFGFGPAADVTLGLQSSIYFLPQNPEATEAAIAEAKTINDDYIEIRGASVKGLATLEYLLFSQRQLLSDTGMAALKRRKYIAALANNIHLKAAELESLWAPGKGNYAAAFSGATGREVKSSLSLLVNQLVYLTEVMRRDKVGKPTGITNNGLVEVKNCEAWASKLSLQLLKENLGIIQTVFTGASGKGIQDLLDHMEVKYEDQPLSRTIRQQMEAVSVSLAEIQPDLESGLVSTPEKLKELYNRLQILEVLLKHDLITTLGLTLTINDNDGD